MDQIFGVAIGAVIVAALIAMMVVFVVKPKNFGDYKSFFRGGIRSNFYIIVVVCRLVIAFSLSAFENPNLCLIASISVMSLLFISILVFKPYKELMRPLANCLVIVGVLGVYLAYSMNIVAEATWLTTYVPVILMAVLLVAVLGNIMAMIKYRFCNNDNILAKDEGYFQEI